MYRVEPTRAFLFASALLTSVTFALFWMFERPGLGIAYGYIVAIILAGLAGGALRSAFVGLFCTLLYALGVYLNPYVPVAGLPTVAMAIRALTFISVGVVVGFYASRSRALTTRLSVLMEELRVLADRDILTSLPNTRAFEVAVAARLESAQPFVLLVGDLDGLKRINQASGYDEGNEVLQRVAESLIRLLPSACDVARIGGDEFAVLVACERLEDASRLASRIERDLGSEAARVTFGWAMFPNEATTALSLYRIADERLYARKLFRGERRGVIGIVPTASSA